MPALAEITVGHWTGFVLAVLFFLALDLGVFHKHAHVVSFKEAMGWTTVWFTLAMIFAGALVPWQGKEPAVEFLTGYIIELSLSMDNVFVIAMIFSYFRVPTERQHRVLFWGILGALVMRGAIIGVGAAAIARWHWLLYFLGGFLVYTGIKMMLATEEGVHPERNIFIRLARKLYPVTNHFEGDHFITQLNGKRALTPLALVLVMVETTDLVFAVDSIPAIFAVTTNPFIVFTSNVFAILGLRSLYFVLAGAIKYFRYLKNGLSIVLVFIGAKMLVAYFGVVISTITSLGIVTGVIAGSIAVSIGAARRDQNDKDAEDEDK